MTLSPFENYAKAFCFMIAAAPKPSKLIEAMPVELPIAEMTLAEKLRAMEYAFYTPWDVAADGRFIMARARHPAGTALTVGVTENWFAELRARTRR